MANSQLSSKVVKAVQRDSKNGIRFRDICKRHKLSFRQASAALNGRTTVPKLKRAPKKMNGNGKGLTANGQGHVFTSFADATEFLSKNFEGAMSIRKVETYVYVVDHE